MAFFVIPKPGLEKRQKIKGKRSRGCLTQSVLKLARLNYVCESLYLYIHIYYVNIHKLYMHTYMHTCIHTLGILKADFSQINPSGELLRVPGLGFRTLRFGGQGLGSGSFLRPPPCMVDAFLHGLLGLEGRLRGPQHVPDMAL